MDEWRWPEGAPTEGDFFLSVDGQPYSARPSKKMKRWAVAVTRSTEHWNWRLLNRPDLWPRYMRVMQQREAMKVRRYHPNDPNRIPK